MNIKKPINCITMSLPRFEGLGSSLHKLLAIYSTAKRLGCYYLHTPLIDVRYSPFLENGSDAESDQKFNKYILECLIPPNHSASFLGEVEHSRHQKHAFAPKPEEKELHHYKLKHPVPQNCMNVIDDTEIEYFNLPTRVDAISAILQIQTNKTRILRLFETNNIEGYFPPCDTRNEVRYYPSILADIRNELIANYRKSATYIESHFKKEELNIAIHVRRFCSPPDYHDCNTPNRELFLPNNHMDSFFCSLIRNLSQKLGKKRACFHIYSHVSPDLKDPHLDYVHFSTHLQSNQHRMEYHINEDPIVTLHHLITADLFMMAKSSFSLIAHFYSTGIQLIRAGYDCSLMPHVHIVNNDGTFNEKILSTIDGL